jgi:hypothetical protein
MAELPCHLQYDLTRWQRLAPHLKLWGPFNLLAPTGIALLLAGSVYEVIHVSRHPGRLFLTAIALLGWAWLCRRYFVGLLDILLHRVRHMDIVIEEKGLGFLTRGERWWFFLDGVSQVEQLTPGIWTILHRNGTVVIIPAGLITADQIEHIRAAGEHGRTPEGIQAAIARGRLIQQIEDQERAERQEKKGHADV